MLDQAHAHGRKVAFVGRSMVRNMGIARDLGYLNVPDGLVVDMKVLEKLPANQVCLICTGSQGEPMAALSRMANRDHVIRVTEGDTVLLASSLIPGNENAIYRVINELTRWGANVVHKGNAKVHVSGHASAGELVYCYNLVQPRNVMPVHGEWRHLRANGDLAIRTGVHPKGVVIAEDGMTSTWSSGRVSITGKVPGGQRLRRRPDRRRRDRGPPEGPAQPRRGGRHHRRRHRRRRHRPAGRAPGLPGPRLRPRRDDVHRGRAADREGAGAGGRGGRRRRRPARAADRAGRRPVGAPHLPAQPDDHPDRHRRLTAGLNLWLTTGKRVNLGLTHDDAAYASTT